MFMLTMMLLLSVDNAVYMKEIYGMNCIAIILHIYVYRPQLHIHSHSETSPISTGYSRLTKTVKRRVGGWERCFRV